MIVLNKIKKRKKEIKSCESSFLLKNFLFLFLLQCFQKFDNFVNILILSTKGNSGVCRSNRVEKNTIIENENVQIYPGHVIYGSQNPSQVLKGEGHYNPNCWFLPCGLLEYVVENKQVRTQKNTKFSSFFFFSFGFFSFRKTHHQKDSETFDQ